MEINAQQLGEQKTQLGTANRLRLNQRSVHADQENDLVWGTDEYGCDCIAVSSISRQPNWVELAIEWLLHKSDFPHPAEFAY